MPKLRIYCGALIIYSIFSSIADFAISFSGHDDKTNFAFEETYAWKPFLATFSCLTAAFMNFGSLTENIEQPTGIVSASALLAPLASLWIAEFVCKKQKPSASPVEVKVDDETVTTLVKSSRRLSHVEDGGAIEESHQGSPPIHAVSSQSLHYENTTPPALDIGTPKKHGPGWHLSPERLPKTVHWEDKEKDQDNPLYDID